MITSKKILLEDWDVNNEIYRLLSAFTFSSSRSGSITAEQKGVMSF